MNTIYGGNYLLFSFQVLTSRIIDWDMAALVPLEAAIKLPTFLSKTPFTDPQDIICDADRDLYIRGFRNCEIAKRKNSGTPLTSLLETSFSRTFFHQAFHSPSIHRKWFQQHGRNSAQRLLLELDEFCKVNWGNLQGLEDKVIMFRASIERVNEEEKLHLSHLEAS